MYGVAEITDRERGPRLTDVQCSPVGCAYASAWSPPHWTLSGCTAAGTTCPSPSSSVVHSTTLHMKQDSIQWALIAWSKSVLYTRAGSDRPISRYIAISRIWTIYRWKDVETWPRRDWKSPRRRSKSALKCRNCWTWQSFKRCHADSRETCLLIPSSPHLTTRQREEPILYRYVIYRSPISRYENWLRFQPYSTLLTKFFLSSYNHTWSGIDLNDRRVDQGVGCMPGNKWWLRRRGASLKTRIGFPAFVWLYIAARYRTLLARLLKHKSLNASF